jgi:hypothetical protein
VIRFFNKNKVEGFKRVGCLKKNISQGKQGKVNVELPFPKEKECLYRHEIADRVKNLISS